MALVEEQQIHLEDSVGGLLPTLPQSWHRVTIRQLLTHTSGLPDVATDAGGYIADSLSAALDKLQSLPLLSAPDERFEYNQTNYVLLGQIVESRTGVPFAEFVQRRFFQPLELRSAVFGDYRDVQKGRAEWYSTVSDAGVLTAAQP